MKEVRLYNSTLKGFKIFPSSILFVAIAIWIISGEPFGTIGYIIGLLCLVLFGLVILVGLFQLFDKRPQIVINENGISDRRSKQGEIKWEQIQEAYPLDIAGQKFISLIVNNNFVFKKRQYKWVTRLNKAVGAQKLNLYLGQLKIDEKEMAAFIQEMSESQKNDRKAVIIKYFDKK